MAFRQLPVPGASKNIQAPAANPAPSTRRRTVKGKKSAASPFVG